ncbi:MAG: 16S rRNA (cytosine(967)-C(5))-methyltransferase RsmB [Gammaproteobacteria bacterium]|nr:16S rRNA (cytosine(967)-C(5))-methyltransferase RsmB [Gammaproteobacteria bacterium]
MRASCGGCGLSGSRSSNPRAVAAALLGGLNTNRSLAVLMDDGLEGVSPRDAALVKEICFGVARWWNQLDALAQRLMKRPVRAKDNDIRALILVGLYQLQHMRVAPHAALAETVEASRALKKPWAAGLVNAVLRRFQREREALLAAVTTDPSVRYLYPDWLLERLRSAWPKHWERLVLASSEHPPMSLRVNLTRLSRADYLQRLAGEGIAARAMPMVASGLVLETPRPVEELPGFAEGQVSVQDGGAQLAAGLLAPQRGARILDACAAPGGKTCHLLEAAPQGIELTAIDIDSRRLGRIRENLSRLGISAEVAEGDARSPRGNWAERRYDRILLDVPCSATGIIRRHPDVKILRKPEQIPQLVETQRQILHAIWPLLRPGGLLLYATCSLLPEENQLQMRRFVEGRVDVRERVIEATWGQPCHPGRQTLPGEQEMDGFYYALLEKL